MTNLLQSATAAAIAAASLTDKQTHDFIAAICPAVFHRIDTDMQSHILTAEGGDGLCGFAICRGNAREERIEVRREIIIAAIDMQSVIDEANEDTDCIDDEAFNNWTPELEASEAIATAKATAHDARDADYIKQGKNADYIAYATLFVMGVAVGLVVACLAASAVLSNLPQ